LNIELQSLEIRSGNDLDDAFRAAAKARVVSRVLWKNGVAPSGRHTVARAQVDRLGRR